MKFSVAGYYGFGNLGDEAVLESMVNDFRACFPGAAFEIMCADYCPTLSGPDVTKVPWNDWPRVVESVSGCDWLIVGGGGLFNCYLAYTEESFLRQSDNFAAFIFSLPVLAYLAGKWSFIYGVGASRFYSDTALKHARMAVRTSDVCTVRDRASRQILSDSVLQRLRIAVHADPAFRLLNAPLPTAALAQAGIGAEESVVAVILRNWAFEGDQSVWERGIGETLREFAIRHSIRLLFIPFQASSDVASDLSNDPAIISRMRAFIGLERTAQLAHGLRPSEISAVLAMCRMAVTMRLHGAILSVRNATPFVALAYDPKLCSILSGCGLERFATHMPADPVTGRSFAILLEDVWRQRETIRPVLEKTARRMAADAGRHVELLQRAVRRPPARRRMDPKTAAFVAGIALEQTRRLALAEADTRCADDEARSILAGIRGLVDGGELKAALRVLRQWRPRKEQMLAERQYLLGFCFHNLEHGQAALKHYNSALQLGFDEFWVLYSRSQLLMKIGDRKRALEELKHACTLRPDEAGAARLLESWSTQPLE